MGELTNYEINNPILPFVDLELLLLNIFDIYDWSDATARCNFAK